MPRRNHRRPVDTALPKGLGRPPRRPRGALPAGSGGVECTVCGATAAADGTGRPIVLRCFPGCTCDLCTADAP